MRANWVEKAIATFPERSARAYLFAAVCIAIAEMLRAPLALGAAAPFVTFYPAIIIIALIAGVRPRSRQRRSSRRPESVAPRIADLRHVPLDYLARCGVFLVGSTFIISAIGAYRDALASYKTHEAQRDLLMRELQHRSRNAYSIVQAIVRSTLRDQDELAGYHYRQGCTPFRAQMTSSTTRTSTPSASINF
ncbi:MAG: HWE histidine kinase domain-containing protein [Pseudolabrys sp.]